ncbi:MAG: winged helix DNA-binding protein [Proteobacteria bacterium]|nr:winged helix DNA-binding protein [Pseudomonadota bacterium]
MTVRSMMAAGRQGFASSTAATAASPMIPAPPAALPSTSRAPRDAAGRAAVALAHELYVARRRRERHFTGDLFGEPTWDILLDLYVAAREDRRVPTTSACIGAHVPPTTALRWLRILEAKGHVEREDDGRDGRRTFVRLTDMGLAAMDAWLSGLMMTLDKALTKARAPHPKDEATRDDVGLTVAR